MTTNYDACRDLSGRRVRHTTIESKLAEWQEGAPERELEKVGVGGQGRRWGQRGGRGRRHRISCSSSEGVPSNAVSSSCSLPQVAAQHIKDLARQQRREEIEAVGDNLGYREAGRSSACV